MIGAQMGNSDGQCPDPQIDGTCCHLTCGRCQQHTDNTHQGHYWKWCKVTAAMETFHFCCPGNCEIYGAGEQAAATPTTTQPQES